MTEIDLIVKYLEKSAGKVRDVNYFHEVVGFTGDTVYYVGHNDGYNDKEVYLFGNVSMHCTIAGTVVLTNVLQLNNNFDTQLKGRSAGTSFRQSLGVNSGMSLLGDGSYLGTKRIYGVGFNTITYSAVGMGAATHFTVYTLNGYLFEMK